MKVWAKTAEYPEGKYLVVRRDGTVPEWPHFVLGGFDPCAEAALHAYAHEAGRRGFEAGYTASVHELAIDFGLLATTPAAVAKADPDAPPHRRDNPAVLAMMRGQGDLAEYRGPSAVEAFLARDEVFSVLRLMNFETGPVAHLFQADGVDVRKKCEDEQAYVLRWLLQLVLKHGPGWVEAADQQLAEIKARIKAKAATT